MFKSRSSRFPSRQPTGALWRPEKDVAGPRSWYAHMVHQLIGWGQRLYWRTQSPVEKLLIFVKQFDEDLREVSDTELRHQIAEMRQQVLRYGYDEQRLARTFALIREAAGRTLGMRHFDSQIRGGLVMFMGRVAEMATGEGKTLTATLPVAAAALAGIPVHVITVNDYLAVRDAEEMESLYQWLGLSLGCIQAGMTPNERRAVYRSDIVYCTNKELVFDYLKDHLVIQQATRSSYRHGERLKGSTVFDQELLLRGLHFAIVDEADSVCMDEARTPLIISGEAHHHDAQELVYQQAMDIARQLRLGVDFEKNDQQRWLRLTSIGEGRIDELSAELGSYWVGRVRRYHLLRQALNALYFFERDRHYLVRDGKVQIIDPHTGRVMPDRTWERGLHQLIETKEGCEISAARQTLAKISFQKFLRRYHWLSGMTGTGKEVVNEFWHIYDLAVVDIPTHHPMRRQYNGEQVFPTESDKLTAIAVAAQEKVSSGRAVLIGTSTVGASEQIAARLESMGISHCTLNAKQDAEEADIVAQAGQPGRVTIATSMAGRGTDIKLHPTVKAAGGLHVILTELQEASRIDRQLAGRCARFGDPGSVQLIVSMEDDWFQRAWYGNWIMKVGDRPLGQRLALALMRRAQKRLEKRHSRARYQLLKTDKREGDLLSITAVNL